MSTSIGEQAENYAEVITGQIVANFDELATAMVECKELEDAKKAYEKTSPLDNTLTTIDTLQERVKIIEDNLGDIVCDDYNSIEPLAVGLFGEWGSGKTHQLKLIKKHLLAETREEDTATIIPVFFNAWRFEKEEHIILPLFQTLLDAVENHERTLKGKAKRGFKSTAYHLKNILFSLHHGISWSSAYKTVRGVITNNLEDMREVANIVDGKSVQDKGQEKTNKEQVGEQSLTQLLQPDQLQSIYLNIPQWIEKITLFENVNFVFLIDDLDRCLPENTLKMLESIKLFLDVPSCAFVLAVDDDVVERGVVHHYRDYLSIYHHKDIEGSQSVMQHELPITGHEYLEKMIQLPIRLPVIDSVNVREFLVECSNEWIKIVDTNFNDSSSEGLLKPSEKLLDFFSKYIPPKPRKVKRTAKLFETKLKLLKIAGLLNKVDNEFVAKLTLLELFSPKLLRFIQNQGYGLIFNRLCHFREAGYQFYEQEEHENSLQGKPTGEPIEKFLNSLADKKIILKYISATFDNQDNIGYTTKEQNILTRAMKIVDEHYSSRIVFDLDVIFDKTYDTEKLKLIVELQDVKENKEISALEMSFSSDFLIRLFRDGDVDAWKEALSNHGSIITKKQLSELIEKAQFEIDKTFNDLTFISNPEWVGQIANFVDDENYITLLKASHDARFKTNKGLDFEIDMFQMTFAEYDKYCELTNKNKHKDEGWGRGRRPVIYVSYTHVEDYISWLNKKMNCKYFLPTEDQWNLYRGEFQIGEELRNFMWAFDNSDGQTHIVGKLKSNEFELYDIYGNVWEWSSDFSDNQAENKNIFGGSWKNSIRYFEKPYRMRQVMRKNDVGFRLLRTLR